MKTARWTKLKYHKIQHALWNCRKRFVVVPSGRRSGKTELSKRKLVLAALRFCNFEDGRLVFAAPTHTQAREIFWSDLKALVPRNALLTPMKPWRSIRESLSTINLWNGSQIQVAGMDRPERIEGRPIDGLILDEYGNMKRETWQEHVRPALSTLGRLGWAWLIGVPEGRNHYYEVAKQAMVLHNEELPWEDSWGYFHWPSSDILPKSEIEAARRQLDPLTFQQEYEGSFVNYTGRAYYRFQRSIHASKRLSYDPKRDLVFCFDFNVDPGVACVLQEQPFGTAVIDEVYIPSNSSTIAVCNKLLTKYISHQGRIFCYGDATGGARGSAKVRGSDWDLVKEQLLPAYRDQLYIRVGKKNPPERTRVNAVNSRCLTISDEARLFVDPVNCPRLVEDFEGVIVLKGGSGEIDKKNDPTKTHLTDALGYYIVAKWPVRSNDFGDNLIIGKTA